MKPARIEQDRRVVGLAMAQVPFYASRNMVFLDCVDCDQSIMAVFETSADVDRFTDAQAARLFRAHGWSIKPTLCPRCQAKRKEQ